MWNIIFGLAAVVYVIAFIALVFHILTKERYLDDGAYWVVAVMSLGIAILLKVVFGNYIEANPKEFTNIINNSPAADWLNFVIISLVFALATFFSMKLVKGNLNKFIIGSPSHKAVIIAITISLLAVGICFLMSNGINNTLNQIEKYIFGAELLGAIGAIATFGSWRLSTKSKASFFYETIILTMVPGFCWFARLKGEKCALMFGIGLLVGGLFAIGLDFIAKTTDADIRPPQPDQN